MKKVILIAMTAVICTSANAIEIGEETVGVTVEAGINAWNTSTFKGSANAEYDPTETLESTDTMDLTNFKIRADWRNAFLSIDTKQRHDGISLKNYDVDYSHEAPVIGDLSNETITERGNTAILKGGYEFDLGSGFYIAPTMSYYKGQARSETFYINSGLINVKPELESHVVTLGFDSRFVFAEKHSVFLNVSRSVSEGLTGHMENVYEQIPTEGKDLKMVLADVSLGYKYQATEAFALGVSYDLADDKLTGREIDYDSDGNPRDAYEYDEHLRTGAVNVNVSYRF